MFKALHTIQLFPKSIGFDPCELITDIYQWSYKIYTNRHYFVIFDTSIYLHYQSIRLKKNTLPHWHQFCKFRNKGNIEIQ